jgi:hypothetical protein
MADTVPRTAAGSIDAHPDFPEFFRQAQEAVWGEFAPRVEQALAAGNNGAVERLTAEVERQARQRAVVAARAMLNFQEGRGGPGLNRAFSRGTPTLSGAENQLVGPPTGAMTAPGAGPPSALPSADALLQRFTPAPTTPGATPGSAAAPPSPAPAPRSIYPEQLNTMFSRPSQDMIARPLMPQSVTEEDDQRTANERLATLYQGMGTAAAVSVPTVRALQAGGAIVRGAGNLLARAPTATGVGAGATALTAGSSEAEPPTPAQQALATQADIDKLTKEQEKQAAARDQADADLRSFRERFGRVGPNSTQAEILALQQFLASPEGFGLYSVDQQGRPVRPDGVWARRDGSASGTLLAMQAYLKRLADDRAAAVTAHTLAGQSITPLRTQQGRHQANATTAASEANMSSVHRFVRDWVPPIAGVVGGLFGAGTRAGMRYLGDRASKRVATEADTSLARAAGGDAGERVGSINQYYTRGGGEAPFAIVPGAQAGFTPRGGQSAMDLYESGSPWMRGGDWGRTAGYAGTGAIGGGRYFWVDRPDVEAARKLYNENPTQDNANALRRAEYFAAASQSTMAFGIGGAMAYPGMAAANRYKSPRPDLGRAEQEVMALNAIARGRNNQLPPLDHRRRNPNPDADGGHWVPTEAPAPAPGAGPAWASPNAQQIYVSPSGENVVYSTTDAQGRVRWWRRLRGQPAEPFSSGPPRTYRRVAEAAGDDGGSSVG